jgi:hypothetical protein
VQAHEGVGNGLIVIVVVGSTVGRSSGSTSRRRLNRPRRAIGANLRRARATMHWHLVRHLSRADTVRSGERLGRLRSGSIIPTLLARARPLLVLLGIWHLLLNGEGRASWLLEIPTTATTFLAVGVGALRATRTHHWHGRRAGPSVDMTSLR